MFERLLQNITCRRAHTHTHTHTKFPVLLGQRGSYVLVIGGPVGYSRLWTKLAEPFPSNVTWKDHLLLFAEIVLCWRMQ